MKTKEELNALKEEIEIVSEKLNELTGEELEQVTCGIDNRKDYAAEQWKDLLLYILKNS